MVLIHDFAEAWTGDLLPGMKNDAARANERKWFEYLALLGTYGGIGNMAALEQLWEDFENRRTINGNLAKDLDKLDNLMQLHIYLKSGAVIADAESWSNELADEVQTVEGTRILQLITDHFRNAGRVGEKNPWLAGARISVKKKKEQKERETAAASKQPRRSPTKPTE